MLDPSREADDESGANGVDGALALPRVLVIDDDELNRVIVCRVAAKAGYAPSPVGSHEAAAKLARDSAFACITLDLSLRHHDGDEMLQHLSMIGCTAPIIIISRCDEPTSRETARIAKFLNLDVWESLPKPVDLAALRQSLERLKARHEPVSE